MTTLRYCVAYCVNTYFDKTKELVFHRPRPTKWHVPHSLEGIEQVHTAKLLGVIFQSDFKFVDHVLKLCSQRLFLLKQLHDRGMARGHLHTLFQAIFLNCITHAFPAWDHSLILLFRKELMGFSNDPIVMALLIMSLKYMSYLTLQ